MRGWWALLALLGLVAACAPRTPLPGMQAGETGRVVRVIDGDALVLDTGQSVRLVGIEAPALRPRGREPEPYATESARALSDMALGRRVQLYYPGLTRDRYDRALAHVVTIDGAGPAVWLNEAMVARGAARVRLYPDTAARGAELLQAETAARDSRTGLWGLRASAVRAADEIADDQRGFTLVEGALGPVLAGGHDRRGEITCRRALAGSTLVVDVRAGAGVMCDAATGSGYRLRGWVADGRLDLVVSAHAEPASDRP